MPWASGPMASSSASPTLASTVPVPAARRSSVLCFSIRSMRSMTSAARNASTQCPPPPPVGPRRRWTCSPRAASSHRSGTCPALNPALARAWASAYVDAPLPFTPWTGDPLATYEAIMDRAALPNAERERFDWEHTYTRDQWLDQVPTSEATPTPGPRPHPAPPRRSHPGHLHDALRDRRAHRHPRASRLNAATFFRRVRRVPQHRLARTVAPSPCNRAASAASKPSASTSETPRPARSPAARRPRAWSRRAAGPTARTARASAA